MDDLYSLYLNVRRAAAVAILEIGSGWSTLALAIGLAENAEQFGSVYSVEVRHPNPFQLLTVDASKRFQDIALSRLPSAWDVRRVDRDWTTSMIRPSSVNASADTIVFSEENYPPATIVINALVSNSFMETFRGQVCHFFDWIPPFTADFIYLDGPDCNQVSEKVRGMTVNFGSGNYAYGLPMSADLLSLEPFFWPGTLIVTDGRGANARFLTRNFIRNWQYWYDEGLDQHWFRLEEDPWGGIVKQHLSIKREHGIGH